MGRVKKITFIQNFLDKNAPKILALLFPPSCPGCMHQVAQNGDICPNCWKGLHFIAPQNLDNLTEAQRKKDALFFDAKTKPNYRYARAVFAHKDFAKILVHKFKYEDQINLAPLMANFMVHAGQDLIQASEVIIPIPLHFRRLWHRQYNQAAELARLIAKKQQKTYLYQELRRIRATQQQASLRGSARYDNVKNAFLVPKKYYPRLEGKHILLIDDVYTTGATVQSACQALQKAPIASIDVLTFSRVLPV